MGASSVLGDVRSWAYLAASANARCASPTAPDATSGRVMSKAPMAISKCVDRRSIRVSGQATTTTVSGNEKAHLEPVSFLAEQVLLRDDHVV